NEEKRKLKKIINNISYENKFAAQLLLLQLDFASSEEKKLGNKVCHSGERLQLAARLAEAVTFGEKSPQDQLSTPIFQEYIEFRKRTSQVQMLKNSDEKKKIIKNEPETRQTTLFIMIGVFILVHMRAPISLCIVLGLGILG